MTQSFYRADSDDWSDLADAQAGQSVHRPYKQLKGLICIFWLICIIEPRHKISNNVVYATSKASYAQSDQSLC